jgi:hypothetical protein
MSVSKSSLYKQPECGGFSTGSLRDLFGGIVDLQIVGSDPNVNGVKTGASITNLTGDYKPPSAFTNNGTFLITIETNAATYFVSLEDGTDYIITPAQATAYLGQWYPAKLMSVNVGTTGSFTVGY